MQYTKDKNKYKYVRNVENLYLKLVVIVSISALMADYYVVKQFINMLNEF